MEHSVARWYLKELMEKYSLTIPQLAIKTNIPGQILYNLKNAKTRELSNRYCSRLLQVYFQLGLLEQAKEVNEKTSAL